MPQWGVQRNRGAEDPTTKAIRLPSAASTNGADMKIRSKTEIAWIHFVEAVLMLGKRCVLMILSLLLTGQTPRGGASSLPISYEGPAGSA